MGILVIFEDMNMKKTTLAIILSGALLAGSAMAH